MKNKKISGFTKSLFILKLKSSVAFYFFKKFIKDKKLREFFYILKRLNYFIGKISHNKFVYIRGKIRLEMYVPGFPSKAFFTSCEKFAVFNEKLPCTTVLMSVTSACTYNCEHCYQRLDKGKDADIEKLILIAKFLQDKGIAFFNIEGGEPFLVFDRLSALCKAIDDRSDIWVNSTGNGITKDRLLVLKKTNISAIMFSLHSHEPEKVNSFMGNDHAWETMEKAINLCHETGIPVTFNSCLPKEDFANGNFEKVMQKAKEFKGSLIQIIEEDPEMFGCTAGGTDRFYINAKGDVQPCEFLNISLGNIADSKFEDIYNEMRHIFEIPGNCVLCENFSKDIYKIYKENNLNTLPLSKELSEPFYDKIKQSEPTELYRIIEKEMK